ncbi:pyridoxal 5'-phosphate synthase glutaminase subunit PdxT [Brachybacterium sp. DNPG3]
MLAAGPRVGVLALQGDVREHVRMLEQLGAQVSRVRRQTELAKVDGLVLPGGESSAIDKLMRIFELREPLLAAIAGGLPVYGTCAGLILLADRIVDGIEGQQTLGGLDVTVRRNAFGGQVESFETDLEVLDPLIAGPDAPPVRAAFIRAPVIEEVGPAATVLATLPDGRAVAAAQGNLLGTSFHPEVTGEPRLHRRFLAMVG